MKEEILAMFGESNSGLLAYFEARSKGDVFRNIELYSVAVHVVMWVIVALSVIYDRKR